MDTQNALQIQSEQLQRVEDSHLVAVANAVDLWTKATTDADSERFQDLTRDKARVVMDFFAFVSKPPQYVQPRDIDAWQDVLRNERQLSSASVYAYSSRVSSFYSWLMEDERMRETITHNPVDMARPKPPKAYQNSQALTDEELDALLNVVRAEADAGSVTARRDYALLLFFVLTGHRRAEVLRLKWGDVKRNGKLTVRFLVKGGDYETEEVDTLCHDALVDYLTAAGRLDDMTPETPLWTGHDRAGQASGALSSHAFAKNLKRYARDAGLDSVHVHQLRHTVARIVGEDTGDMTAIQRVLGHKNLATTRVYAQRVTTKKNTHSSAIVERFGLDTK